MTFDRAGVTDPLIARREKAGSVDFQIPDEQTMSNFFQLTKHPKTGLFVLAEWLDDYFGHHCFGVRFPDGQVFSETDIDGIEVNGIGAETSTARTVVECRDGIRGSNG